VNKPIAPRSAKALFHPGIRAAFYGLLVSIFLILTDQISQHFGLTGSQLVIDDLCGGLIAGLLAYRYEYSRSKYLEEKLKTIELMNHHIRNAMQVIVDSVYLHGHARQFEEIQNSVKRIDWALREILPGTVLDRFDEPEDLEKKARGGTAA